ncbi:MAG: T9SS type A sorting domain-containing protein, partial [Saprospiraceae bacterium]|nr:T9SS type A sorting domain-containing protein [Saprospiraceae bacterium]
ALGAITGAPAGVTTAGSPQTGTITNGDQAVVSFTTTFSGNEGNSGTQSYTFTFNLSNPVDAAIEFGFSHSDGTATLADNDYLNASSAFTVPIGAFGNILVGNPPVIQGDTKVEANEIFNVVLSANNLLGRNVVFAGGGSSITNQITIVNDDAATVTLTGGGAANEGNSGTTSRVFTATLNNAVQGGFSVPYTTNDGTATTADNDYTDNDGTLNFTGTAGETKTITVLVTGDFKVEADETFTVALGAISGAPAGVSTAGSPQTGTITNDEVDYGDIYDFTGLGAPLISTLLSNNGARHNATLTGPRLGTALDGDPDGQISLNADGDDTDAEGDDEDGVVLPNLLIKGTTANVTVTASAPGVLNGWVDFENDFSFDQAGNQVFTNVPVVAGANNLSFMVPVAASTTSGAYARFRISTASGLTPYGLAADGEVEDYVVSIIDNQFSINDMSVNEGNSGTTNLVFTVSRSTNGTASSVDYAITGGTATSGTDYAPLAAGTINFGVGGPLSENITITVNGDVIVENNETIIVTLSNPVNGGFGDNTGVGTITNDDAATVTLSGGVAQNEGNSGTTAYTFTATLNNPVQGSFTVPYTTNDGTATTADNDYTDNDGTLNFAGTAGETKTITVLVNGDNKVELNETFTVALGAFTGAPPAVTAAGSPQTGTITNDDQAVASFTTTFSGNEGNSGTQSYTFTFNLSNPVDAAIEFGFSHSDGTATLADNDYLNAGGSFTVPISAFGNILVGNPPVIQGDTKVEANEIFNVVLSENNFFGRNVVFAGGGSSITNPITIVNDDAATVTLTGGGAANEGNSGTTSRVFTATLNNAVQGGFSLPYTTNDGTATTADNDYTDNDGTLNFAGTAGETKTITVLVTGDNKVELDENFTVALGAISGAPAGVTTAGSPQTGTITNDDAATVAIAGNQSGPEATTPQTFSVTLSNPVDVNVTVLFNTSDGTATTADNDYTGIANQTVTFAAGTTTAQSVPVAIINDNKVEANEVYNVAIGTLNASGRNVTLGTSAGTGTITNDDAATVTLAGGTTQNEGNSGTISYTFTATLNNPVQGGFTVPYTTNDGSATTADNDYTDNDGTFSFTGTAGESKTITVLVNGDNKVELNETFTVALGAIAGAPAGVTTAGSPQTGTITNDDAATVAIAGNQSGPENITPQTFSVTLSNPVDVNVTVLFNTSNGTASTADNDYTGITNQTVTFAAGTTTAQSVPVAIINDNKVEANEVYNVAIGTLNASGRNVTLGTSTGTGTINNDDSAVVTLSGGGSINEGNTGTTPFVFTATLNNPVQGGFTLPYTTNDGLATTANNDYQDNDGTLTFAGTAGETFNITVLINGDLIVEANEGFTVALGAITGAPAGVTTAGSPQSGLILNDEIDYGDAPDSYGTLLASDGARHLTSLVVRLGATVDGDLDGQPGALANGDDTDAEGDDDDGVILPNPLVTNTSANITLNASIAGFVNAWVDFNLDGSFDAGELVLNQVAVAAGSNSLSFAVPNGATPGSSYARFRFTQGASPTVPTGLQTTGEVEDYAIQIVNTQFSINDPIVTEGNAGTTNLAFVITRSNNASACSINYAITGGTATTADNDYQPLAAGTASFTAGGALTQTINVVVVGDVKVELNETVDMTLSNPVNGSILDGSGTGTITNDDQAILTITNPTVTEGDVPNTVTATFTINMSNPSDANVSVNYNTVDNTATVGNNDYQATSGTHTFTPGQQSKTVAVTVVGDCAIEANETYFLRLSGLVNNGRNVILSGGGATLDGTGTINNDDALPVITCPANLTVNAAAGVCNATVTLPLPTTSSVCGASTLEFRYRTVDANNVPTGAFTAYAPAASNTVNFIVERYEVEWRITDGSGSSTCSFFLVVRDIQPPTITCPANQNVPAGATCTGTVGTWSPVALNDNCAPPPPTVTQVPSPATVLSGHNDFEVVTLTATDEYGNMASCSFTVTLKDVTPPVAKCKNATVNLGSNGSVTVAPATVNNVSTDNCTFTLSLTPNTFTCANIGTNLVTLKATDAGGNMSTCTATVTIKDMTPPTALCKNINVFLDDDGYASITAASVNNGSFDACGIATATIDINEFDCGQIGGTPVVVKLTLKDNFNNTSSCLSQVTVKDAIKPDAVCTNTTVNLQANGIAVVQTAPLAINSTDNCSVWTYSPVAKAYNSSNLGVNNLTITVKDFSNNASTCVSQVTVLPYNSNNLVAPDNDQTKYADPVENMAGGEELLFKVFPNPTEGQSTVLFELPQDQLYYMRLFDINGRLILDFDVPGFKGDNSIVLDLNALSPGVYIIDILSYDLHGRQKLIIQR